jgi:hypothetical protein
MVAEFIVVCPPAGVYYIVHQSKRTLMATFVRNTGYGLNIFDFKMGIPLTIEMLLILFSEIECLIASPLLPQIFSS